MLLDEEGSGIVGYPIAGTVLVRDETDDIGLEKGVDYELDYHKGLFSAKMGGHLSDAEANGHELSFSFQWTTAEPIELSGENSAQLDHRYISHNGLGDNEPYTCRLVICTCEIDGDSYTYGDTPGSEDGYIENIDFVVDYDKGTIVRTADSRIPSFAADIDNFMYVEFAYCAIRSGEQVRIEYDYIGETYTLPRLVSSYGEAAKYYGPAWNSENGDVVSPLSLAAYIAFQNGMPYCYCCAVERSIRTSTSYENGKPSVSFVIDDAMPSAWEAAFSKLEVIDGIDIVVPLSAESSVWSFGLAHLTTMKSNQDERIMIVGADGVQQTLEPVDMISIAQGFSSEDVWVVGPSSFRFRNPVRNTVDVIAGYYCAAAVAGYNASVPQYMPLTRKAISGFYSANEYNTKLVKQNECANGVMYVDEINGQLRVLHGRTSSTASTIKSESNVTLTKYYIVKSMRRMFENGYIGEIISDNTLLSVKAAAFSLLTTLSESNYLYNFNDLVVQVDEMNPTQVNVSFQYIPTYGMNYIQLSFGIDQTSISVIF